MMRWDASLCVSEPIVPELTEKLDKLKLIKEEQDARFARELEEAAEKLEAMKELLLTENVLLRQCRSFIIVITTAGI